MTDNLAGLTPEVDADGLVTFLPAPIDTEACCDDCDNPVHRVLAAAKPIVSEEQYERLVRAFRKEGVR